MSAYESRDWFEFAIATVGAAAALSGLLFVAMSINIERIVAISKLPDRAAGNLILFVLPLLVGTWVLVPGQPRSLLGLELLVTGLFACAIMLWLHRPSNRVGEEARYARLFGSTMSVVVAGLIVVGGATLVAEHGGGLYWIAPAVVLAFTTGLVGAWVLLVEILR